MGDRIARIEICRLIPSYGLPACPRWYPLIYFIQMVFYVRPREEVKPFGKYDYNLQPAYIKG